MQRSTEHRHTPQEAPKMLSASRLNWYANGGVLIYPVRDNDNNDDHNKDSNATLAAASQPNMDAF